MTEELKDGMHIEFGQVIHVYRGYRIRLNENSDTWSCSDLNVEHAQLSVVKEKVAKIDAEARKLDGIPVLILRAYSTIEVNKAMANLIDADGKGVWVTVMRGEGPSYNRRVVQKREKIDPKDLLEDTPENRSVLAELIARQKAHNAEAAAIREATAAIPRWTPPKPQPVEALPEDQSQKLAERPIRKRTR